MRRKQKRRVKTVYSLMILLFGILVFRIYSLQNSDYSTVADTQFSREITLAESRGYIYDINMQPLVNEVAEKQYIIMSDESTKHLISTSINNEIKKGLFIKLDDYEGIAESEFVKGFNKITRYSKDLLCTHIIGYTNSSGRGVAGIEKSFDKILSDGSGRLSVVFNADASDNALKGDGIELKNYNYNSKAGVRLTIDKEIQKIAEEALDESGIECGAVVILDVSSSEIRAMASVPCYDVDNIEGSLSDKKLPFLNRVLSSYPVGSVFKPFVAAAALANGAKLSRTYNCNGSINIGSNVFSCYNNNEHGDVDLNLAIEKSCNTFFINMGIDTGAAEICESASLFGFGKRINLCSTISSEAGKLPSSEEIKSESDLANICFGQGTLLATPLQIAAAYNVFANNGIYNEPYLLKELIDNSGNAYAYYKSEDTHYVTDKNITETINNCLYNNMINGTGVNGKPDNTTSAGKTATAQTGRYNDSNEEILCTWFAGFFPFEAPLYTVVVFNEDGRSASTDCAPVFKEIAEKITEIKNQPS